MGRGPAPNHTFESSPDKVALLARNICRILVKFELDANRMFGCNLAAFGQQCSNGVWFGYGFCDGTDPGHILESVLRIESNTERSSQQLLQDSCFDSYKFLSYSMPGVL